MCGRYSITKSEKAILKEYPFKLDGAYSQNYNLAPSQSGLVITSENQDIIKQMHFGLVPFWAKEKKVGYSMINARSETLLEKPAFKTLLTGDPTKDIRNKRCLVLADGFYEWEKVEKEKLPFRFILPEREVYAFAGLWSSWQDKVKNENYYSFTIITTTPNELVSPIHDRMPVILSKSDEKAWLADDVPAKDLVELLDSYPSDLMEKYRVSQDVNKVVNNHADLILPINSQ